MRFKMTALVVGLAGLTACSAASKFDGTWLIQMDPNAAYGGSCIDGVDLDAQAELFGQSTQIVDIFGTDDGQVVVMFDGDYHIGTPDGSAFEASYTHDQTGDGWSSHYSSEVSATKESGILNGTARVSTERDLPVLDHDLAHLQPGHAYPPDWYLRHYSPTGTISQSANTVSRRARPGPRWRGLWACPRASRARTAPVTARSGAPPAPSTRRPSSARRSRR